jgi:carbon monoxide dehydrogenase subunit G
MKVSGVSVMHAPPDEVWTALTSPDVLARAIPGCRDFEPSGAGTYRFTIAAGFASLQGVYTGQVTLSEPREPTSFVLTASGAGDPGTVSLSVRIRLTGGQDGTTVLSYDADGVVGGMIAAVGQRMVTGVAQRMTGDFFRAVDNEILAERSRSPEEPATGDIGHRPEPAPAGREQGGLAGRGQGELVRGVLIGSAGTLAGVAIGAVLRRRKR